ncbi:hypothetical protein [Campylobacter concisus]|uniref:hypothetical protein n=1 Tax=Campylobacter concisus TaxID=199 RepID=UPI000B0B34DF|nr:hypothetical protein [Campylobacter concisus]
MIDIVYSIFFSNEISNFWDFFDKKLLICKGCGSEFKASEQAKFILSDYALISVLL